MELICGGMAGESCKLVQRGDTAVILILILNTLSNKLLQEEEKIMNYWYKLCLLEGHNLTHSQDPKKFV